MLQFEGDRDFSLPPEELFVKLTDARFLASCLPDVENISQDDPHQATFTVRPNLAFVRGTLAVTLQVAEKTPPISARMVVKSKGVGASSTVVAALSFAAMDAGTRMHWIAEIQELGGLLKLVPNGLICGAAQKVMDDAWKSVEAKLRIS
ncbi:MAG TPA: SRPBCC domain-containing protein [Gemmataceae bacterium]|nr:SRPBCC domain-containing protein [Gemmataceae bacterium]